MGRLSDKDLVGCAMGGKKWANGYEALASLDPDKKGFVEGGDLAGLYLWFDRNQDAVCQADEAVPLSSRVRRLNYRVTPDAQGDVTLPQGAQLLNGQWVQSWDWWSNVWVYPVYARDVGTSYGLLFPTLVPVRSSKEPVTVYEWKITAVHRGNAVLGQGGMMRFVSDSRNPSVVFLLLERETVSDVFVATLAVASRRGSELTWAALPERTTATLLGNGDVVGRTTSFFADYEWEASAVPEPTRHRIAGISDADFLGRLYDFVGEEQLDLNHNAFLYLRGILDAPVPTVPLF